MTARVRIFSLLMCVVMIFCSLNLFCLNTVADGEQKAYITTTVNVREAPGTWNASKGTIGSGMVFVLGSQYDTDGDLWYLIRTSDGLEGYVYSKYIVLQSTPQYDENFEQNLSNFPESYRSPLRELHNLYPNWKFTAHNLDITFDEAVDSQYGVVNVGDTRKWVELTYYGEQWRDQRANLGDNKWIETDPGWTYANRQAIAYFVDPRNSLTANKIFAFMQQSYDAAQTENELRTVVAGTFLANGYGGNPDAYINDIMNAANKTGVGSCVIASAIIAEQGVNGNSDLISGNYAGYEGYYNFFNFGASGSTREAIVTSGLSKAKEYGWNSISKSILGGAECYADGYTKVGQDTFYYKSFNFINKIYWHQFDQSLYGAWTKAGVLKKAFIGNQNATLTFKIPVFKGMPGTATPEPTLNPTPTPTNPPVTPTPTPSVSRGDVNGDGRINVVDLASVKLHILGKTILTGDKYNRADVNGDSKVNVIDLASVKLHILGKVTIS